MRRYPLLAGIVLVGLIASLIILGFRWRLEARARTVEVIVDADAWRELAVREGRAPQAMFEALRERGATGVAVYERTLRRLREEGRLFYASGDELRAAARALTLRPPISTLVDSGGVRSGAVYITASPPLLAWIEEGFRGILGAGRVQRRDGVLEIIGHRDDVDEIGLGYLPSDLAPYRRLGMGLILRARNYRGLTAEGLAWKFTRYATVGKGHTMVFELADVLGYERLIVEAAGGMRELGYRFGRIESFTEKRKQRGEDALTRGLQPAVIRLFSVTPEELAAIAPPTNRDKFIRAARERHIRLLYVRPVTNTPAGVDAVLANFTFVEGITAGVREQGFHLGRPNPLPPVRYPLPLLALSAAGALALGAILIGELGRGAGIPLRGVMLLGLVAAGLGVTVLAWVGGTLLLWRKILALGAAVAGATLAVALPLDPEARAAPRPPLLRGLGVLWQAAALSAGTGVIVAALLTSWPFMLAIEIFLGVKLSQILPPVLVGFLLAMSGRAVTDPRTTAREIWRWLDRPLRLQYAVVAVAAAVVAVMLLGRSGNFGLPLFAIEERMRVLLEEILVARPRTKEFLIGHPALMLAGAMAALRARAWVVPLAVIGVIGQAGMTNSFSHIHTPLLLIVTRTLYALVIGSVLGTLAVLVAQSLLRRWWRAPQASSPRAVPSPAGPPAP